MRVIVLCVCLLSATVCYGQAWSGIIDSSRATDWTTAGVPGGIPTNRTKCGATISATNDVTVINNALAHTSAGYTTCGADTYIQLGVGTFNLSGGIVNKTTNTTLRGSGPDQTILKFTDGTYSCATWGGGFGGDINQGACDNAVQQWLGNTNATSTAPSWSTSWTGGYSKGSTTLTVGSTANMTVGLILWLDQIGDSTDDGGVVSSAVIPTFSQPSQFNQPFNRCNTSESSCSGGATGWRTTFQMVRVASITDSTHVVIDEGLHMPTWRSGQTPQVSAWGTTLSSSVYYMGVEDLTAEDLRTAPDRDNPIVASVSCYGCWVKNVRTINAKRDHIRFMQCLHCEARDNYMYGSQGASSQSYGIESMGDSASLIINNIFHSVTAAFLGSCDGCVQAYNYAWGAYYIDGGNCLDAGSRNSACSWPAHNSGHGAGGGMSLLEGNQNNGVSMDAFHGATSMFTLFRNYFKGNDDQGGKHYYLGAIRLVATTRASNIIGNVLGDPSLSGTIYNTPLGTDYDSFRDQGYIYQLGFNNSLPADDPIVASSTMRWGNYDTANAAIRWEATEVPTTGIPRVNGNPVPANHDLPASFFLSAQPSFWTTPSGTPNWPPIGPDVTGGNVLNVGGHVYDIPAKLCFNSLMNDPNYSSSAPRIKLFDATDCYSSSSATATAAQYAFRCRNDDGSETAATWLDASNTNCGFALDTTKRLRIGVDTTNSLGDQQFRLEAKKSTDTLYQIVPTAAPSQQTISYSTAGAGSGTIPPWVTSIQVECVGGGGAGARSTTGGQGRGGGGGGGYAKVNTLSVSAGAAYSFNVGAGGTSGASPTNGGISDFTYNGTTYCRATGGTSAALDSATGGAAGTGTAGDVQTAGSAGASGGPTSSGAGGAGATPLGGSGGGSVSGDNVGTAGSAPGGGGSGGRSIPPSPTVQLFTSSGTWTRPTGVTSITTAECWGGGGNGANDSSGGLTAGGGGGGAYAVRSTVPVSAASYSVTVGTAGGTSSFTGSSNGCSAGGGTSATADGQTGGAGSSTGTGDTVRTGGTGANGSGTGGGGGGEGACTTGTGNNGSGSTGGSGCDGGNGGNGSTGNTNGSAGTAPGGGGGGARRTSGGTKTGGAGARGQVQLTYTDPSQAVPRDGGVGGDGLVKITYTAVPPVILAASSNIAAGGNTATSAQLTAPSGKTTASFTPGKISDDTNPVPSVIVASNFYTELEWALKMRSPDATNGDSFNFRVTKNGQPLDTYSVTPTITASGTAIIVETAANGSGSVVSTQNVEHGSTVVAYCISRSAGVFQANVACTWSLTNKTGGVVDGDLVAAGDNKSATFTGGALGSATIHALTGALAADSGTITTVDTTAPTPGNSGTITTSAITENSITLNWTKGTDTVTAQASLLYSVYRSSTNNIGSVANAEANGVVQLSYTADINSFVVTGPQITPSTTFYFTVLIKDGSGNKAAYTMMSETTTAPTEVFGKSRLRIAR